MNATVTSDAAADMPHGVGFEFASELAASLSAGPVELPSFPDVALRVQDLLADDSVSTEMVVRIVGAEPMLAAALSEQRLLTRLGLNPAICAELLVESAAEMVSLRAALGR